MPTDPSSGSQPSPVPLGQPHPNAQRLAQQQPQHVPPHLRYPQQQLHQQHQQQPAHPLAHHQSQHLQRQQYAALSTARNLTSMQQAQPHLAQPAPQQPAQGQPPQPQPLPRQPQRGALGLQEQPPQHQYYAVNGGYAMGAYPQVASQYNLNSNYMYPPAFPYNTLQPGAAPQQPGPQNPTPRQYPTGVQGGVPQRQPPSRVTLPAPRKKTILAIVDPDTNEEVKVDNVDAKPAASGASTASAAPVKIPARTSRPLELVADPADNPENKVSEEEEATAAKSVEEKEHSATPSVASKPSEIKEAPIENASTVETSTTTPIATESEKAPQENVVESSAEPTEEASTEGPVASEVSEGTAETQPSETLASMKDANGTEGEEPPSRDEPQDEPQDTRSGDLTRGEEEPIADAERETGESLRVSDVSQENAATTTEGEEGDADSTPSTLEKSPQKPAAAATSPDDKGKGVEKAETANGVAANGGEEEARAEPVEDVDDESPAPRESTDSAPAPEPSSGVSEAEPDDTNVQATPRRERPVFREGDRRVYPPDWMLSVRGSVNAKRAAEYISALSSNNIYKSGPGAVSARMGDPRGSRTMRGGGVPLSGDPRGKRAFPTPTGPGFMGPGRGPGAAGMVGSGGVGAYDAFDLRSARSQNPPPAPKGQQGHMRDVRGSRQGGRDRFDGPMRNGHGPIDPFVNYPPVEKLKRSEHGWKRNRESDDEVASKVKQIRSLLNKLTLEKFDKIFKQIIDINISSYEILTGVVKEVFEKALFEPKFSGMYAELCVRLDISTREMLQQANIIDSNGKPVYFRNILLNNCREEFTRFALEGEIPVDSKDSQKHSGDDASKKEEESDQKLSPEEKEAKERAEKEEAENKAFKAKRRMLANVRFIGELFLKDLLKEHIIHRQCIQKLLAIGIEKREEDVLEALCKLLSKTGAKLSMNKDAITHIDGYFKPLEVMSRDHTLPARVRFMLQDLIEQRANGWKVRREEVGAKTIAEIHKDIEKEERAKAEAQAAARERRPRGGSMHSRDRGAQNFQPRVAMTMASRQKAGSGVSRSTAMLEKHANRAPSSVAPSFQGVRLGPGGSKANSASSGASGPSLRPGGSRYGALAALEQREISPTGQSGDARRSIGVRKSLTGRRQGTLAKPEPVDLKPKPMDPEALRNKTRSIVEEYWSIELLKEAKECIEQEVQTPNYPKFVEEAVKISLDAKISQRDKTIPLFVGLVEDTIPRKDFISGFSAVVGQLSDIEMDDPRASEFLAKYIGAVAATRKLGEEGATTFGLGFLDDCLGEIGDLKRASKLVVAIFAALYKNLAGLIQEESERKTAVVRALQDLDIDLAGKMSAWNPMRGISILEDMLKDNGVPFLLPLLPIEKKLTEALIGGASGKEVENIFQAPGSSQQELRTDAFMKMVIRISLDWLLMNPPSSIKETFVSTIGKPLVRVFGGEVPREAQMAALLETQAFVIRNLDVMPPHKEGNTDKPGDISFEALYDADVVEEETFLRWKDDTGRSTKVPGKERMIIQTSGFFRWLVTAEVEE